MDKVEVLAHITAASRFKDDTRYLALAAAVADFQACSKVRVYGPGDSLQDFAGDEESVCIEPDTSTFACSLSLSTWVGADVVQEAPVQKAIRQLLKQSSRGDGSGSWLCERPTSSQHEKTSHASSFLRGAAKTPISILNPPFETPSSQTSASTLKVQAARTPEVPRPNTAPAGSVAPKSLVLGKRLRSQSSSFETLSVIPDSQEKRASLASGGLATTSFEVRAISSFTADHPTWITVPEQSARLHSRPAKRRQTGQAASQSEYLPASDLAPQLHKANPRHLRQLSRRVFDGANKRATTSSNTKSLWPPNPRSKMTYPPPPEQISSLEAHTSNVPTISPPPPLPSDPHDVWLLSTPPAPASPAKSIPSPSPCRSRPTQQFSTLTSLPPSLHAPLPPTTRRSYTTHLTAPLRTLMTRLPFRPVSITRDINLLERGYWHLRIPILPNDPAAGKKRTKDIAGESKRGEAVWTEDQFVAFWHALAEYVASGRAGWGVGIYREVLGPEPRVDGSKAEGTEKSRGAEGVEVSLKVTCWGEMIPHIYLLMWVLSEKKIEGVRVGVEWMDARGEVVVRMKGENADRR